MKVAALQSGLEGIAGVDLVAVLEECGRRDVDLLVLPECFFGGMPSSPSEAARLAVQAPYASIADALWACPPRLSVVVGLTERGVDGRLYSSAVVWQHGKVAAEPARKLFPREAAFSPGGELPVYTAGAARFGIVICYDCNYVEPARLLKSQGAQLLACPLNNDLPEDVALRWATRTRANLIARAVENDCFVIAADVAGAGVAGRLGGGATQIIAPDGEILAAANHDPRSLVTADLEIQPVRPPSLGCPGEPGGVRCLEARLRDRGPALGQVGVEFGRSSVARPRRLRRPRPSFRVDSLLLTSSTRG